MPIEDPEFPFDLDALHLEITLPANYPSPNGLPQLKVLNADIPEGVKRRIRNRMEEAAEKMPKDTPYLKELLRILDRSLEKWMVALPTIADSGSATIKVYSPAEIKVSAPSSSRSLNLATNGSHSSSPHQNRQQNYEEVVKSLEMVDIGLPIKKEASKQTRFRPPEFIKIELEGNQAGTTEMVISKLILDNIGLAIPMQLSLSFSCARCQATTVVKDLRADVDRTIPCVSCKQHMEVRYTRSTIHQHSQRLGFLRTKRCYPTDLVNCSLQLTCDTCSPTEPLASSIRVEEISIGERLTFPCRHCRQPCEICIEGRIIWNQLPGLMAEVGKRTSLTDKASRLPTKVGEPLPDYGTCSHYRKSHRWFRFPCCGRAFPCDECHCQDATSRNHEPEWANRQICGYCSREFPISQRYCECGEQPAAAARHTAHWEGGKGTRDQTAMSKKDGKKYRNQQKTISSSKSKNNSSK